MSNALRLSLVVPLAVALCGAAPTAYASLPKADTAETKTKIERAAQPPLQQFARCAPGQEYQSAWIEEHWAYIPNVGYRVVDLTYHSAGCGSSNWR